MPARRPNPPRPSGAASVGKPPLAPGTPDLAGPDAPGGAAGRGLPLPHERDESTGGAPAPTPEVIRQAARDIEAGLVDTDLRATPGLDAPRRDALLGEMADDAPPKPRRAAKAAGPRRPPVGRR
jgi:hypothetical protein